MTRPPDWPGEPACHGHDPEWWFASLPNPDAEQAIAVCERCPVIDPCLAYALDRPWLDGIWAATTPTRRRHLRRDRTTEEPPTERNDHGNPE